MTFDRRLGAFLATTILAATTLLYGAPAHAQYYADGDRPGLMVSTTTTSSAVAVGVIMMSVVAVKKEPRTTLRHYLRDNEVGVRAALAAGAGTEVHDFAALFGVRDEDVAALGRLLRRERATLNRHAFVEPDVDAFIRHLLTAMQFDPALRRS